MNQAYWKKTKALFNAVLDAPAAEREKVLRDGAHDDAELRASVEKLLSSHDEDSTFMEVPAVAAHRETLDIVEPGWRIGSYLVMREIGRGGMGTVYLAARDDGEFRHNVAMKLVKRGMDTDLILRRFRYERQILADLDHPNIARLLDGGTTLDGRPYFVMEFIEGEAIDAYCAKHDLSIDARLNLFLDVCGAVQYAHQNLIVHRDIKTSNIIVTAAGIPKLLDFGIAKLLGPDRGDMNTDITLTLRALTPEYASPEQVRGEAVTTASDVYSLGVLLYELLAGRRPYDIGSRTPDEIARTVCETDPLPPSGVLGATAGESARRKLRGDIDTIVLKAMQKEPGRRYSSIEQLAADIRRHLDGLPIAARRDSTRYRAAKFIRRNRVAVGTGALVFLTLIAGLATTMWQAKVARDERARAERRFGEVRSLATSFLFDLHDAIAPLPGSTPVRAMLVKQAITSLDGLARESGGDPALQRDLAAGYERIGNVQGNSYNSNLGDTKGALISYRKSLEIRKRLAAENPSSVDLKTELARGYQGMADMSSVTGDLVAAAEGYQNALAIRAKLQELNPADQVNRAAMADIYNSLGDTQGMDGYANLGDVSGAMKSYERSVKLREEVLATSPGKTQYLIGLGKSLMNLGFLQSTVGDSAASRNVRLAVEMLEQTIAEDPNDMERRLEVLAGYARLRYVLADAGKPKDAIAVDRLSIIKLDSLLATDSGNAMLKRNLGVSYNYLGRDSRAAHDPTAAVEAHRKALRLAEELAHSDNKSAEHRHDVAITHFYLAEALSDAGDTSAALAEYETAASMKEKLHAIEPSNVRHADDLALIYIGMARIRMRTGDVAMAVNRINKALPLAESAVSRSKTNLKARANLAAAYSLAGEVHERMGKANNGGAEAQRHWRDARDLYSKSSTMWREISNTRPLLSLQASSFNQARQGILRCDSALAQ